MEKLYEKIKGKTLSFKPVHGGYQLIDTSGTSYVFIPTSNYLEYNSSEIVFYDDNCRYRLIEKHKGKYKLLEVLSVWK